MSFEKYISIYEDYNEGETLRAGGSPKLFSFNADPDERKHYRLFVMGETGLFYQWKNEPNHPAIYHTITDALDTKHAFKAQYALNLSSKKPEKYIRRAYKKLLWPPRLAYLDLNPVPDEWKYGIYAAAEDLKVSEGG